MPESPVLEYEKSIQSDVLGLMYVGNYLMTPTSPGRDLALFGSTFHDVTFEITFMAIKPPDTTGKIKIEELPDKRYFLGNVDIDLTTLGAAGHGMALKHIWDVGETDTYTLTITPPSYLPHRPTWNLAGNPDSLMTTCLDLSWDTAYKHGGIYPANFTILVFTRWFLKTYVPVIPHIRNIDNLTWAKISDDSDDTDTTTSLQRATSAPLRTNPFLIKT